MKERNVPQKTFAGVADFEMPVQSLGPSHSTKG